MAQSSSEDENKPGPDPGKPVPPPMQSVIKGGWTYRVENPTETVVSALKELASALKELAEEIRGHSWAFVRHGPSMLSPPKTAIREKEITELAGELDNLAKKVPQTTVTFGDVDAILARLRDLGFFPDNLLVSNVARAIHALEKRRTELHLGVEER